MSTIKSPPIIAKSFNTVKSPSVSKWTPTKNQSVKRLLAKPPQIPDSQRTPSKSPFPKRTQRMLYESNDNGNVDDFSLELNLLDEEVDQHSEAEDPLVSEMTELLPSVIEAMRNEGYDKEVLNFLN